MKNLAITFILISLALVAAACGSTSGSPTTDGGKTIKSATVGDNEFLLTVKDASGKPVEVSAVALKFYMPAMGTMPAMTDTATFTTTGKPGVCRGQVKLESAGEWQVQVSYESPAGSGKTSFSVTAQ